MINVIEYGEKYKEHDFVTFKCSNCLSVMEMLLPEPNGDEELYPEEVVRIRYPNSLDEAVVECPVCGCETEVHPLRYERKNLATR